jgi:ribosomal protein S18 acetylase RimI-like enzyme
VLGRRLKPGGESRAEAAASQGVEVTRSERDELALWIAIVAGGFARPDAQGVASHESYPREAIERVMSDMASAPSLRRYLARRDGVPAGGASMRASDGICQLCGAATLPEHRRHGVQRAMLERRLNDAAAAGCEVAVVTTLPGSQSQHNVQRLGFDLLYTRAILVLA